MIGRQRNRWRQSRGEDVGIAWRWYKNLPGVSPGTTVRAVL